MASQSHLPVPRSTKRRHHHHHRHRGRRSASEDPLPDNHHHVGNVNTILINNNNVDDDDDDGGGGGGGDLAYDDKSCKTRRNERTLSQAACRRSRRAQHLDQDEEPVELPLPPLPTLAPANDNDRRRHHSAPSGRWRSATTASLGATLGTALGTENNNINNNNNNNNNNSVGAELAKVLVQNGGAGGEVTGAANLLARLGITLDLQAASPPAAPNGLHYNPNLHNTAMHLSKEHVVEVKEEDERRTSPEECERKLTSDTEEDDFEERNKTKMTNSATQTQAGTPGTPTDPRNVTAAGENEAIATASLYHSAWPPLDPTLWHSGPSSLGGHLSSSSGSFHQDNANVMSASSTASSGVTSRRTYGQQQLGAKVEMVYGLLSMLGSHDRPDMSRTLLAMSSSPDSCVAMRQSGCLPLLVQLLYSADQDAETRARAAQALQNLVHAHPDDKRGRREARVLKLLDQIRVYCDSLRDDPKPESPCSHDDDGDKHPGPTIATLMKLSFDEEHRHAMCQLGGLHAIAQLIQADHEAHGSATNDQNCVTIRRYAGMALTNLTFGDGTNKALLCSFRDFMRALVAQLASPVEDLRQVTASVLRNLSWRADSQSKQTLREVGAVAALMRAAMEAQKESTFKSVLSALWNLSAHCSLNKVDICAVEGALAFLVQMLSYKAPSKTLAIIENAGGILRNISSHVAVREDYRAILREHNCLQVLLQQLKSPSLTIVSNACGTLWNLSARCQEDQRMLWALGAPAMLRSLVHSKHKMISMGSSATLKNLLSAKPENDDLCFRHLDSTARSLGLQSLPGLYARKQKALEQELDQTLAETCDNIEPSTSPSTSTVGLKDEKFVFSLTEREVYRQHLQQPQLLLQKPSPKLRTGVVSHSDSRESVTSTHSDSVYERLIRANIDTSPPSDNKVQPSKDESTLHASMGESDKDRRLISDRKFLQRYNSTMANTLSQEPVKESKISSNKESDQNHNDVAVNHVESGLSELKINDQHPNRNVRHAWEDDGQILSKKEEFNACSTSSEKEEGVELSSKNINNVQIANGVDSVTPARSRLPQPRSFVPVRNKYLEAGLEEDLECPTQDRPIDFSRRYGAESEPPPSQESTLAQAEVNSIGNDSTVVYGDYAETDLDQPTDYSLQYGEEEDLSDFDGQKTNKHNSSEFYSEEVPICIHEDTVKTYCTEGTPYETPCNFSTATSLSDLRIEPTVKEEDEDVKDELEASSDAGPFPDASKEGRPSLNPKAGVMESGSVSPAEKLLQFCDEGTPGVCMSRCDSLSSLDKHEVGVDVVDGKLCTDDAIVVEDLQQTSVGRTPAGTPPLNCSKEVETNDHDANKTAPLSADHQCAEETPLMFSRASSLGSLSSCEQQDDRSSVVSEFSRLTSGVLSPSELPDSPSQLIPASPRQTKAPVEFTNRLSDSGSTPLRVPPARFTGSTRPLAHPIVDKSAGNSVFEDRMAAYKVEDTPVEFSRATSLSSLSIDDEPRDVKDGPCKSGENLSKDEGMEKTDVEKELSLVSEEEEEEEEEEDESMLAACINIGMQNSSNKQTTASIPSKLPPPQTQLSQPSSKQQPIVSSSPLQRRRIPMPSGIPVIRKVQSPALSQVTSSRLTPTTSSNYTPPVRSHSAPGKPINESSGVCEDSMYRYCTEGTPANISHAGSHSDLPTLSFRNEGDEDPIGTELSDDSSNLSGDNENILAECIQSGMPKAKTEMAHGPRHAAGMGTGVKRASVPNTSMTSRRVASASPSGSVKSSPGLSRNPSNSPKRKPVVNSTSQRTLPQPNASAPKPAARVGVRPSTATPSSSPASSGRPTFTPPRPRTGGAKIVRAVNRNVHPGGRTGLSTDSPAAHPALPGQQSLAANDEMVQFAREDSPCNFSSRSSLSDLTINSSEPCKPPLHHLPSEGPVMDSPLRFATEDTPVQGSYAPSLSSLGLGDEDLGEPEINVNMLKNSPNLRNLLCLPEGCSSDESGGGAIALSDSSDRLSDKQQPNPSQSSASEDVLTVLSRNASLSSLSVESLGSGEPSPSEQALLEQCISSGMPKSRGKKPVSKLPCLVDRLGGRSKLDEQQAERPRLNSEAQSESGGAEDAVPQEKKLNFVEDVMKDSAASNGTWADDSSPNEISCPSISISGPLAGSLKSENYRELSDLVEEHHDSASEAQDLPSLTDSWMLEAEATKVATAVMGHSLNSLDSILPPSEMESLGSLSQSYSGRSLPHTLLNRSCVRKKSLPANDVSVEFNLSGSCTSHLDNVKAPSMLDEMGDSENSFISIASITSETADLTLDLHKDGSIGDVTFELIRPAARLMADAIAKHAAQNGNQEEAQEPLSTYHEITELSTDQDITLEPGTETIASDSELNDEIADTKTLEAPDLPCDSQHTTPSSSSTSTPKKQPAGKQGATPKERREIARDRYQTYTISSPTVEHKAEPSLTPRQKRQAARERYQTYTITSHVEQKPSAQEGVRNEVRKSATVGDMPASADAFKKKSRVTPKQRRQEDRDRFLTRTLEKDFIAGGK